jgi:hypothetical protein
VVLVAYPGGQRGSGGVVTSYLVSGNLWTVHAFNSSGTFTA